MRVCLLLAGLSIASGCTPEIGDKCVQSTDCSTQGDRLCDTSQPGGYCTQFNCTKDSCPDEAACVLFNAAIQGCRYDDRAGGTGSRVARAFCVAKCADDSDCRPRYRCGDPRRAPWNGIIQDADQSKRTCLVLPEDEYPDGGFSKEPPPVCSAVGPAVPPIDASTAHIADAAAPVDASTDGPATDASVGDAGVSDAADASDAADGG